MLMYLIIAFVFSLAAWIVKGIFKSTFYLLKWLLFVVFGIVLLTLSVPVGLTILILFVFFLIFSFRTLKSIF